MSVRQAIVDALKTRLESVSALGEISYWRDCRQQHGVAATTFRDTASSCESVNTLHEHRVRVEIESLVYGADLGTAMNTRLGEIFEALKKPLQAPAKCVLAPVQTRSAIVEGGHEAGVVGVVLDVAYRTAVFGI